MHLDWPVEASNAPITGRTTHLYLPLSRFVAFLRVFVAQTKKKEEKDIAEKKGDPERDPREEKKSEKKEGALRSLPPRRQLPSSVFTCL